MKYRFGGGIIMVNPNKQQMLQIFLSIILAAATAHVLQVLATVSKLNASTWFLLTITIVAIVFLSIMYILNQPSSEKIPDIFPFMKALLIFFVTVTLFAIARFVSFYFDENIQILNVREMFSWLWGLVFVCGIILGSCAILEYIGDKKNQKYIILAIVTGIIILLASCMLTFGTSILQLRGVIE